MTPRPEPAQGNIVGDGGAGGFGTQMLGSGRSSFNTPNPNDYADLVIYLVHGTWGSPEEHWSEEFIRQLLMPEFNIPRGNINTPEWSGNLSRSDRGHYGRQIAREIDERYSGTDTTILLVGYSHGGNVNKRALNWLNFIGFDLDNTFLINIATPNRTDYRLGARTRDNMNYQHINVSNNNDFIQTLGARPFTADGGIVFIEGWFGEKTPWFMGPGRYARYAVNIPVGEYLPSAVFNFLALGIPVHSAMHGNIDVWVRYILPAINELKGGCE